MRAFLCLVAALICAPGCNGIASSPTAPAVVPAIVEAPAPVPDRAPLPLTMTLSSGRQDPMAGDGLSLTAAVSGQPVRPITYTWGFGDASPSVTTTNSFTGHTYTRAGDYAASVTLLDGAGQTAHATLTVQVDSPPSPTKEPPAPTASPAALTISLTCTAKAALTPTPCNVTTRWDGETLASAKVLSVTWDWGEGATSTTATPKATAELHSYRVAGAYTVFATVTATTPKGVKTETTSTTIIVP